MADAAVEFLLENLTQLLLHHANLIIDAKDKVEKLETDLRFFKAFLKDSTKKRKKDNRLRELVRDIRGVVYEAEDIIDASVTQAAVVKSKNYFLRAFSTPAKLLDIARQVESICGKITEFKGGKDKFDFASLAIGDEGPETSSLEVPLVRKDNVVGFEDEAKMLIGYLNEKTEQLDVISIIGMPGLGKTTLAGKIFRDPALEFEFPTRIWVYVSQEFTNKDVFLAILKQMVTKLSDDMYTKSAGELAQEVASRLEGGKFLIVMDDVWTAQDWDTLKIALPSDAKMGKVLITSRQQEVARAANRNRLPHNLRFLDEDESWLLFQLEVFGKPACPSELEVSGKLIVERCHRLPLAIVVIGGILATKFSASYDLSARRDAWEKVSRSVSTYLQEEDPLKRMEDIISLSYDKLPYHLKECFIYLGMFPEDFEIPVWNLIRMWIAEGLIQPKDGISHEEIAENYLDELINRNLVRIDKRKADGKVKTCRLHDMLRDFCKTVAGNERENFLQEIKNYNGVFQPPVSDIRQYRRLCIHSNVVNFLLKNPYGPLVRSFVCFSNEEFDLRNDTISAIPAGFKLLRVLEAKPIRFPKIPSDLYHLIHLRYITLSLNSVSNSKPTILPAAFSQLWNIQTLIIDTASRTLEIRADILKMIQLRHLKTNASASLIKPGKDSKEVDMLQTLGTISPESCTDALIVKARNLKKLGIRGKLALLMDSKGGSFDSLRKLGSLEKLKLINDTFPNPSKLGDLPPYYRFPRKLRSLTLSSTSLDWSDMSILGSLENLQVLKLKDKAFWGRSWEAADGGFRHLEVLHIGHTNLAVWVASGHHFPRLRRLKLRNCENLEGVPIGLADIPSFQVLELFRTEKAAASAKKFLKVKEKQLEDGTTNCLITEFKLFIFPPLHNDP